MKFLAFILSIYILALNFAPCQDNDEFNTEVKTEITQHNTDDGHMDLDLCSPFCQCHCCQIHATYFKKSNLTNAISEISTEVFFHTYGLEKTFISPILQPPKV